MNDRHPPKRPSPFAPVVLDVHFGIELFNTIVEKRGVAGWNQWKQSMTRMNPNPLVHSGATAGSPPVLLVWLDFSGADLAGRNLAGVDFSDVGLARVDFRGASLERAKFEFCILADVCFADADLRNTSFQSAIVDHVDFTGAELDGICIEGAMFDLSTPPIGLPPHLASNLYRSAAAIRDWQLTSMVSWDVPTTLIPARVEVAFNPMGC